MTDYTQISEYLRDLGSQLAEAAQEAKASIGLAEGADREYRIGRLMGLREAISLMQAQAIAFDIPMELLGLGGIDPDTDLL